MTQPNGSPCAATSCATAASAGVPAAGSVQVAVATLRDIAIARSGDKGNRATLSLVARDPAHYAWLDRLATVDAVRAVYAGIARGAVDRYSLPQLCAVHFVLHDALGGGVTRSLALDAHGKSLSAAILALPLQPASAPPRPPTDPPAA